MKTAKWRVLQKDADVLRWYDNVARGSATTAIDRIRLLARYVAYHHTTPGKLVERAKKDRKAIEDQLSDFIGTLEKQGKAPGYILNYVKAVRSYLDFHEVRLDRPIQASVNVQLVGEPAGVKEGGVLSQVQREINVEALPMEIPEHIELDVGGMAIGDTLRLADLPEREGVKYLDNPEETVLATVTLPTRVEEPEPEVEEGEELAEGEVPPEEQPEGAAEGAAEPAADAASGEQGEPGTTEG